MQIGVERRLALECVEQKERQGGAVNACSIAVPKAQGGTPKEWQRVIYGVAACFEFQVLCHYRGRSREGPCASAAKRAPQPVLRMPAATPLMVSSRASRSCWLSGWRRRRRRISTCGAGEHRGMALWHAGTCTLHKSTKRHLLSVASRGAAACWQQEAALQWA